MCYKNISLFMFLCLCICTGVNMTTSSEEDEAPDIKFLSGTINSLDSIFKVKLTTPAPKLGPGKSFDFVSRATLLKLLAGFEDSVLLEYRRKKVKPIFTVQYANNEFTRPFIFDRYVGR